MFNNIYKCGNVCDGSASHPILSCRDQLSRPLNAFRPPLPLTPLNRPLIRRLLGEDAIHYEDEQHHYRPCHGVIEALRDGVHQPATKYVADVFRLDDSPEGGRQVDSGIALGLATKHGVFHVIHWAGAVAIDTVPGPTHLHR